MITNERQFAEKSLSLQALLGFEFKDPSLLLKAMTHRSFAGTHNEKLEFLGDSVINLVIGEYLFLTFQSASEGELTRMRSNLVNGRVLSYIAKDLSLHDFLLLGQGELKTQGQLRSSVLEDAFEALIGAIYLDSNLLVVKDKILKWFAPHLAKLTLNSIKKDPKTTLQELIQNKFKQIPKYVDIESKGLAHEQTFYVQCEIETLDLATIGKGSNKRKAEQHAAKLALEAIQKKSV